MKQNNIFEKILKYTFGFFIFLMPFHALITTFFKCKLGIDVNLIRFWKEIFVAILGLLTLIQFYKHKTKIGNLLKGNYLIGISITFIISSIIFVAFPFFEFKVSNFLGFKYDVFFIFCLIIGVYLNFIKDNFDFFLKTVFISTGVMLLVFLPWFLFGDISLLSDIFGYSNQVSTYKANACISFSQNVAGHHRFQGTFGGPITFSIYLVVFYLIYIGYILKQGFYKSKKISLLIVPTIFVITSIFVSYSKTSILGFAFGIALFIYLSTKIILKKSLNKKQIIGVSIVGIILLLIVVYIKRDLFLHLDAILNRLDNLHRSLEMFIYNPIGYGLGIAGPSSQIGRSIESLGNWQILAQSTSATAVFLPENWYVQILLEQGIIGFAIFISLIIIITNSLYKIALLRKDYLSIGIYSAFLSICFMSFFCHSFEDAGTVYPLFLIIGASIAKYGKIN